MNSIIQFISDHRAYLEGVASLAFGWFVRETPVVYKALATNGGIRGFANVIMDGQTPEKQEAKAVAAIAAISPAANIQTTIQQTNETKNPIPLGRVGTS